MRHRKCGVCSGTEGTVLHNMKFKLLERVDLPDNYNIVVCPSCGFVFGDTSASQEQYNSFYRDHNIYENPASFSDQNKYEITFDYLIGYWTRDQHILDIGFANGELLKLFQADGYTNLYGLDPSAVCVQNLNEAGITAYLGSLLDHSIDVKFDCIILSHVMEHILDIQPAMDQLFELLAEEGTLYLETPDLRQYQENSATPFSYIDIEHINHFTEHSLSNLMALRGYKIIDSGTKKWPIGNDRFYPATWTLGCKPQTKDPGIEDHTRAYITSGMEKHYEEINKLIESQEEIIVWGTGSLTQRMYSMANLSECNIRMYVDNNKQKVGTTFGGRQIGSPTEIDVDCPILILSVYDSNTIVQQIHDMKLKNKTITLDHGLTD
ncbi:MAG TPA: class I SAM-dependent methyltransferase [Gammaproteobacteria bacterium]|nr:class I SAM-dependent methyltransferase [Gammaproteobacteria bacterium]